jgi:hypothetical protein
VPEGGILAAVLPHGLVLIRDSHQKEHKRSVYVVLKETVVERLCLFLINGPDASISAEGTTSNKVRLSEESYSLRCSCKLQFDRLRSVMVRTSLLVIGVMCLSATIFWPSHCPYYFLLSFRIHNAYVPSMAHFKSTTPARPASLQSLPPCFLSTVTVFCAYVQYAFSGKTKSVANHLRTINAIVSSSSLLRTRPRCEETEGKRNWFHG